MTQPPVDPGRKTDSWGLDLYDWLMILTLSAMICLALGAGAGFHPVGDVIGFGISSFFVWCGYGVVRVWVSSMWPNDAATIQKVIELLSIGLLGVVLVKIFGS